MSVGMKIEGTGIIQYAGAGVTANKTRGLLTIFTDTANATPNSGGVMQPRDYGGIDSYTYEVVTGSYSGYYSINRNDTVGATIWYNINTNGQYKLGDFYDYVHWPTDNKFVTVWDNSMNPIDDMTFEVKLGSGSQTVLNTTVYAGTTFDPSSGVPYLMGSAAGSSGAFAASSVNTNWTSTIQIINTTQMQPTNVIYRVYDVSTNNDYISGNMMLSPPNWSDTVSWTQRYPSIMGISLTSM